MKRLKLASVYKYFAVVLLTPFFLLAFKNPATVLSSPAPAHIVFIEGSFTEALRQAKLQNKYIFADAYASWCGPCQMLKNTTFTDGKAAEFYNSKFINVSIDMEKGEGPGLAAQWGIQAYPTLIIFKPDGKPVLGTVGFINAGELIKFGKAALARK